MNWNIALSVPCFESVPYFERVFVSSASIICLFPILYCQGTRVTQSNQNFKWIHLKYYNTTCCNISVILNKVYYWFSCLINLSTADWILRQVRDSLDLKFLVIQRKIWVPRICLVRAQGWHFFFSCNSTVKSLPCKLHPSCPSGLTLCYRNVKISLHGEKVSRREWWHLQSIK